jgi:Raf kinase inhibitor-like YbhB/YbcL family protein
MARLSRELSLNISDSLRKAVCMNVARQRTWFLMAALCLTLLVFMPHLNAQQGQDSGGQFRLKSSEFANNTILPISTISNIPSGGVNVCSMDGSAGGDQSPELSWSGAPSDTQTFVLVAYDVTAAFTHWGMYNIPAPTTELPAGAGVAGSIYGAQVFNDVFFAPEYDGPCPPANVAPFAHQYVFTLYALDIALRLPASANFPATGETLYHALIDAGQKGHILGKATLTGLYSTTPARRPTGSFEFFPDGIKLELVPFRLADTHPRRSLVLVSACTPMQVAIIG